MNVLVAQPVIALFRTETILIGRPRIKAEIGSKSGLPHPTLKYKPGTILRVKFTVYRKRFLVFTVVGIYTTIATVVFAFHFIAVSYNGS